MERAVPDPVRAVGLELDPERLDPLGDGPSRLIRSISGSGMRAMPASM